MLSAQLKAYALACVLLVVTDITQAIEGFVGLHRIVQKQKVSTHRCPLCPQDVVSIVDAVLRFNYRKVYCLQRSTILVCLLRRFGVPAELVIGCRRFPFHSHAWVEVEGFVLGDHPKVPRAFSILERC